MSSLPAILGGALITLSMFSSCSISAIQHWQHQFPNWWIRPKEQLKTLPNMT
jgi:hypothetical protein